MSIPTVVTGGFGNGTFTTTIALVVTMGYSISPEAIIWTATTDDSGTWTATTDDSGTWTPTTDDTGTWSAV